MAIPQIPLIPNMTRENPYEPPAVQPQRYRDVRSRIKLLVIYGVQVLGVVIIAAALLGYDIHHELPFIGFMLIVGGQYQSRKLAKQIHHNEQERQVE